MGTVRDRLIGPFRSRWVAAVVLASASYVAATLVAGVGILWSISICAFGECGEPENAPAGFALVVGSVAVVLMGPRVAARWTSVPTAGARGLLAVPIGVAFGVVVARLVPSGDVWEQLTIVSAYAAAVAFTVLPTVGGLAVAGTIAAAATGVAASLTSYEPLAAVYGLACFTLVLGAVGRPSRSTSDLGPPRNTATGQPGSSRRV